MPKFLIDSAGDQYFLPDSSRFYFDALPGEKYLRYVPNTDHSLMGSDAPESAFAFYQAIVADRRRPKFSYSFEPDGSIVVKTETRPSAVVLWQATSPVARDFRLEAIGPAHRHSGLGSKRRRELRREGARAGARVDGLFRRVDLCKRQPIAVQIYDRRSGYTRPAPLRPAAGTSRRRARAAKRPAKSNRPEIGHASDGILSDNLTERNIDLSRQSATGDRDF